MIYERRQSHRQNNERGLKHARKMACAKTWTGLWTVDYGLWTVDCGLWTMDCGLWIVS